MGVCKHFGVVLLQPFCVCPLCVNRQKTKPPLSSIDAEESWNECQPSGKAVFSFFWANSSNSIILIHLPTQRAGVENELGVFEFNVCCREQATESK